MITEQNSIITKRKIFAARNGYTGFVNYFNSIFNSSEFDKIYVLKGGPGTGKSSMMKKIVNEYTKPSYTTTAILCSSDVNSLDGFIIQNKNAKVAMLDGTAPHERDAVIPGAIDTIVNLGDCWDEATLTDLKNDVLALSEKKKDRYMRAYNDLRLAGNFYNEALQISKQLFDFEKARKIADGLISNLKTVAIPKQNVIVSAFCKDGYKSLPTLHDAATTRITLYGPYLSAFLMLSTIKEACDLRDIHNISALSPLSGASEALYFEEKNLLISISNDIGDINCGNLFRISNSDINALISLDEAREKFECYAQQELIAASDAHFKLEKIYYTAMNFGKITEMRDKILNQISEILE